jgi:hypothetical protein
MESAEEESSEGSENLREELATGEESSEGASMSLEEGTVEEEKQEERTNESVEEVDWDKVDLNKGV